MAALRAHYSTAIGGPGPLEESPDGEMGSWFLENAPGWVSPGQHACLGMVANLPHWPPYWAQVWGDIILRNTSSDTSQVDLFLACSWFFEDAANDYAAEGYLTKGDVILESLTVTGTEWQTFQIPVREMLFGNPIKESDNAWSNYTIDYDNPDGYWYAPLSYWWENQTYFPWLRVKSGPAIEVKILRLWDQATCSSVPAS